MRYELESGRLNAIDMSGPDINCASPGEIEGNSVMMMGMGMAPDTAQCHAQILASEVNPMIHNIP